MRGRRYQEGKAKLAEIKTMISELQEAVGDKWHSYKQSLQTLRSGKIFK